MSADTDTVEDDGLLAEGDLGSILAAAQGAAEDIIDIDLSEAPRVPVGEGVHLRVLNVEVKPTKDGSKKMLAFRFEVVTPGPDMGQKFRRNYMMTGGGTGFTRDVIEALTGEPQEGLAIRVSRKALLGAEMLADVSKDDQGFAELKNLRPVEG